MSTPSTNRRLDQYLAQRSRQPSRRPAEPRQSKTAPQPPVERLLLTVEQAAERLSVGRSTMYELIAAGAVRTVRVGRLRRVQPEALGEFIAALNADDQLDDAERPRAQRER